MYNKKTNGWIKMRKTQSWVELLGGENCLFYCCYYYYCSVFVLMIWKNTMKKNPIFLVKTFYYFDINNSFLSKISFLCFFEWNGKNKLINRPHLKEVTSKEKKNCVIGLFILWQFGLVNPQNYKEALAIFHSILCHQFSIKFLVRLAHPPKTTPISI